MRLHIGSFHDVRVDVLGTSSMEIMHQTGIASACLVDSHDHEY